jgi:hypothetical protein
MTETITKPAPKEPRKIKRLTARQWASAETLWEAGEASLDDLAKKFSKDKATFKRHFDKHGIKKGSSKEELKKHVTAELAKSAAEDTAIIVSRIKETKEEHYKMAAGLAKLTWAEILKAKQDGLPVSIAINNLKAIDTAMSVLKKAREERYAVLGLDRDDHVDEDGLPELIITELTAEQVQELRARDHAEIEDVITGGVVQGGDEQFEDEVVEEE